MQIAKFLTCFLFVTIAALSFAKELPNDQKDRILPRNEMQDRSDYSFDQSASESGYEFNVTFGPGLKINDFGYNFLKLSLINGYRINPYFYIGIGTGVRLYLDNHAIFNTFAAYPVIPFFVHFNMNLTNKNVSPYLTVDMGYSFESSDQFKGIGVLLIPMAGIKFPFAQTDVMNLGIGYEMQMVQDYHEDGSSVNYGANSVNIGFSF